MKTKFYLDKRGAKFMEQHDSLEFPVKISINHGGSSSYIATGISVQSSLWASKPSPGRIIGGIKADRLNIILAEKKLKVDKILEELRISGELHGLSASEIKLKVEKKMEAESLGGQDSEYPVLVCFERFITTKTRRGTIEVYKSTMTKLRLYGNFIESMTFRSITPAWLSGFEAFLEKTSPSANARGIYLRCIRTVFNWAIAEGMTAAPYPFKRFKIRSEPTKDRSLTAEELRMLRDAPCNKAIEKYRDLFFLSFYLCGMNLEDIIETTEIKGGRIEKRRIKTGQPLSVKVEPEAMYIINKYKGTGRIIDIGKGRSYKNFQHRLNRYLKRIGKVYNPHSKIWEGESLFPELSFYYARYSWATIAAELDVPERTIGAALGHSTSKSVTSIYTRVDMRKKIDAANRKVIDFCFGDLQIKK